MKLLGIGSTFYHHLSTKVFKVKQILKSGVVYNDGTHEYTMDLSTFTRMLDGGAYKIRRV